MGGDSQEILGFNFLIWPDGAFFFLLPVRQIRDAAQTGGVCWGMPPSCVFADDSAYLGSFENDISRDVTSSLPGILSKIPGWRGRQGEAKTKKIQNNV